MSLYKEPEWARVPAPQQDYWCLLEIKGGVEMNRYPLHTRSCTVLGRAADQVHIPLHHESASRQHARIAFDSQGIPWLKDLQSTHGTTCNKRPLPSAAIGKQETNAHHKGARGIMIFPGDILQFGASTRLLCVEGPAEFERGAWQAKQLQNEQMKKQKEQEALFRLQMENDDTAMEDNGEGTNDPFSDATVQKAVAMDAQVPEKHRKTLERLNAMKYKLQNLQTEDDRIQRKGELSEGQEKQLQRNAEREKVLEQSIEELETELYDKLHPEQAGRSSNTKSFQSIRVLEEEDEDEFFDRTKRVDKSVVGDEESEATLVTKWKRVQKDQRERQEAALQTAQAKVDRLSSQHAALEARGDTEEAFFVQNDLQIAKEQLQKITNDETLAEENLREIEKFLRIVNPKLKMDRKTGYIGEGNPTPLSTFLSLSPSPSLEQGGEQSMGPPTVVGKTMLPPPGRPIATDPPEEQLPTDSFSMLPPPPQKRTTPPPPPTTAIEEVSSTASAPTSKLPTEMVMPPPKRMRVVGPAAMPPPMESSKDPASTVTKSHPEKRAPVPQRTLTFLASMTKLPKPDTPDASLKNVNETPSGPKTAKSSTTLDPKKDEWRAPAGQDGSGMTKLNAKFAGRY